MRAMRINKTLSQINGNRSTVETFWIGTVGSLHMTIGFGTGAENFTNSGAFFDSISFVSLDSQKKDNLDDWFGNGDEVISFISSASGSQRKERSEMSFVQGITGDETSFMGGAICRDTTCCTGVSCEGTDVVMILLVGKGFSEMTSWTGGDGILISVSLYGPWAFSETIFCMGGDGIGTVMTSCIGATLSNVICWIGGDGIAHSTICFGLKADSFFFSSCFLFSFFPFFTL